MPDRATQGPEYGLRYIKNGKEVCLHQIAGGGRLRLHSSGRSWWDKPRRGIHWETYPATEGVTWETRELALEILKNLTV